MPRNHIIGHDGRSSGDDALALSRALAPSDCHRIVAHAIEFGPGYLGPSDRYVESVTEAAEDDLQGLRARLQPGEELRVIFSSSAARALDDLAEDEEAELVLVGPTNRKAVGRVLLGMTAEHLLHGSPCPVAVAARGFAKRPVLRRLLLGYDGGAEARRALEYSGRLAEELGAVVDVVTAVNPVGAPPPHAGALGLSGATRQAAERVAAAASEGAVAALPAHVLGAVTTPHGTAAEAITDAAVTRSADLVVLGSRGYGRVKGVLLGSTGRSVLHHAACSVLVLPRAATRRNGEPLAVGGQAAAR